MAIVRVPRRILARSVIVFAVLALGYFFLGDLGIFAPAGGASKRSTTSRASTKPGWLPTSRPVTLAPTRAPSSDIPDTAAALIMTAPVGSAAPGPTDSSTVAPPRSDPADESSADSSSASAPSGPSGPAPAATGIRHRAEAQALEVRGRLGVKDGDDLVPAAGATVRFYVFRPEAAGRSDDEWMERRSAQSVETRSLEDRARERGSERSELTSVVSGPDGRFQARLDHAHLEGATDVFLVATALIDGRRYASQALGHRLGDELVAFSNDDWNADVLELELVQARTITVFVHSGGRAVAGARIVGDGDITATTGASGRATLELPNADSLSVVVTAPGFASSGALLDASATDASVDLKRPVKSVVLVVDEDGKPVQGATVCAASNYNGAESSTPSGADGRATLGGLEPGSDYTVSVYAPERSLLIGGSTSLAAGSGEEVRVVLKRAGSVSVSVSFEEDVPENVRSQGTALILERLEGGSWSTCWSLDKDTVLRAAEKGEPAVFSPVAVGTYRVTAVPDAGQHLAFAFTGPFQVGASQSVSHKLELGMGTVVSGWVKPATGATVDQISVRFRECGMYFSANGSFLEVRVPAGAAVTAVVEAQGHLESEVRLGPGSSKLRPIQLVAKRE